MQGRFSGNARGTDRGGYLLELLEQRRLLAAGDLDLTFGVGGKVITDFTGATPGIARNAMVVQADGKIVAVGESSDVGGSDFAVARFNPNGSPDLTFGNGGTVTTDFTSTDSARGVAVQSDGKIVVVGYRVDGFARNFAVVRYNTDGSLDTLFGTGGAVFTAFSSDSTANAVAIQGDGKIVVAGADNNVNPPAPGGGSNIALVRYNADGSPDGSFGSAGKVSAFATGFDASSFEASALAIQTDGKLVVAGMRDTFAMVARFDTSGAADTSFDGDGFVLDAFGSGTRGRAFGLAIQGDDKIVFGGAINLSSTIISTDVGIGRLNADGSPDNTFDSDGRAVSNLGSAADVATDIALQTDGKIVASAIGGAGANWSVLRYNTAGVLDTTFSGDGRAQVVVGSSATSVAIQGDGKIITAGDAFDEFQIARHNLDGTRDTSFGAGGFATNTFLGSRTDDARRVAIQQTDGKLVVVGTSSDAFGEQDIVLARYNVNGTLDTSFGDNGRVRTDLESDESANAIAVQGDGKLVVVGQSNGAFLVGRYKADGSIDTMFGTNGWVSTPVGSTASALAVAIQTDGKIVVAGEADMGATGNDFALVRYNANGSLDTSGFGSGGKVTTSIGTAETLADVANALLIQPDGKIVAAGSARGIGNDFALARYNADGTPDNTFGSGGNVTTSFAITSGSDIINAIALQPDGKIVAAGQAVSGAGTVFGLARYATNGSLDWTSTVNFNPSSLPSTADVARGVVVQADGKIVAAGGSGGDFALARVDSAGVIDSSFGTGGQVTTDFAADDQANSLVMQADGKLVAVGTSFRLDATGKDFALARYGENNIAPTAVAHPTSVSEGGTVVLSSAGSSDPNQSADTLTYAWDLDGDSVYGEIAGANGNETGQSPTFSAANIDGPVLLDIKLRVTDSVGASDTTTAQVTVNNVAPTVGEIDGPLVVQLIGATVETSASFSDAGTLDTHLATWNWGDGNTSGGTVSESNGSGSVTGTHVYTASGSYTVTLTVTDDNGGSAQSVFEYVVINAAPVADANGAYSVSEGGTVALSSIGSNDPDGSPGPLTYTWDLDGDNIFGETGSIAAPNGDEIGPSPTFSAASLDGPSSVAVKLRVTDSFGAFDTATTQVNVSNVAPTVGAIAANLAPQLIGTTFSASASFADAGKLDVHIATWNWGDGNTSGGTVSESNGTGTVNGNHVYSAAGVYTVTLTVDDGDGGATQSVFQYAVIYDPTGGFVTGGGTINSPAGAMPGNPTATGIANFAFVSKYQHGANVPTGETRFRFNVGDFAFESTSYDWMVISGAKARYRGVGKVNGTGNYGFQITIIDGDRPGGGGVDRFRIKIWSLSAGNAVVYDNQLGSSDDEDPVTAIRGGSIRINT